MSPALLPPAIDQHATTVRLADPLSRADAVTLVGAGAIGAFAYVVVLTGIGAADIADPGLAVVAVLLAGLALALLVHATRTGASLVSPRQHALVLSAAFAAATVSAASSWTTNSELRDDWGPVLVGAVTMLLAVHRPPRELVFAGIVAGALLACLAMLQAEASGLDRFVPLSVVALQVLVPALAFPFGGAAFGGSLIAALARWRASATTARRAESARLRTGISRSVQQSHVSILNAEVVPLLSSALERGELDASDRERAGRLAGTVRAHLLEEADRTWLGTQLEDVGAVPFVDDPDRRLQQVGPDVRSALRALLRLLADQRGFEPSSLRAGIRADGDGWRLRIDAELDAPDTAVRHAVAPYLAVLRRSVDAVAVDADGSAVALRLQDGGE